MRQAPEGPVELRLRVPGWCDGASVEVAPADQNHPEHSPDPLRHSREGGNPVLTQPGAAPLRPSRASGSDSAPSPLEGEGRGEGDPRHALNQAHPDRSLAAGDYTSLRRVWRPGDQVILRLPMPPRRLVSDPRVTANVGRVSLARGPLIYCVESHDRPGLEQDAFALPDDAAVTTGPADERLPGMTLLDMTAVPLPGTPERGALYQSASGDSQADGATTDRVTIRAIPYFAWANRGPSTMDVWLRRHETLAD